MCVRREREPLCDEVIMNEAEGGPWEEVSGCIRVARIFRAERESRLSEAVGRDVWKGGGKDGGFDAVEGSGIVGMIVRVIETMRCQSYLERPVLEWPQP